MNQVRPATLDMQESNGIESRIGKAAVFIDYANLHDAIIDRTNQSDAHGTIVELVKALRTRSGHQSKPQIVSATAYADFNEFAEEAGSVQQLLYLHGIEPRFVSCTIQPTAAEVQLSADAIDLLHSRPDIGTFVFISGDRPFLPLIHAVQRYGRDVRLILFAEDQAEELLPSLSSIALSVSDLIPRSSHRLTSSNRAGSPEPAQNGNGHSAIPIGGGRPSRTHQSITNTLCIEALQLIEDYFGQYDEIYLTPLLRKMSEELGSDAYDPKSIISELEEAGAVWLEKRRGFPHDYTVLLLDEEHPDVQEVLGKSSTVSRGAAGSDYDHDSPTQSGFYD